MIQSSELRIGSVIWVSSSFTPEPDDLNEIIVASINDIDKVVRDDQENGYSFDMLYGIPLTPELLCKIGFAQKNDPNFDNAEYFEHDGFPLYKLSGKIIIPYDSDTLFPEIKYLHHLQNLFYAITGNELEIKL